jgi:hypothetical protein
LADGLGLSEQAQRRTLRDIAGTWKAEAAVDAALVDQDRIDGDLWK